MLSKVQKMWVDALRSGEYKQGHGALHLKYPKGDKFCCLGVACDLFQKHGPGNLIVTEDEDDWSSETQVKYNCTSGMPPRQVQTWLGISGEFMTELANMNDGSIDADTGDRLPKRRFSTIANRIEKEFSDS